MASTGAVLYVKTQTYGTTSSARPTGAALYISPRFVSSLYSATSVTASSDLSNQRPNLPPARSPVGWVTVDGKRLPVEFDAQFWNFLRFQHEVKLGGMNGATLPDVVTTVETTQAQSATTSQTVVAVAQQAQANAESLDVARQVLRNSTLTGADQIPPVALGANIP
jgi:hypothetical protein